jgi:hypothetical protein
MLPEFDQAHRPAYGIDAIEENSGLTWAIYPRITRRRKHCRNQAVDRK